MAIAKLKLMLEVKLKLDSAGGDLDRGRQLTLYLLVDGLTGKRWFMYKIGGTGVVYCAFGDVEGGAKPDQVVVI